MKLHAFARPWIDGFVQASLVALLVFWEVSIYRTRSLEYNDILIICAAFSVISMISLLITKNYLIKVKTVLIYLLSVFINYIFLSFLSIELSQHVKFLSYRELGDADGLVIMLIVGIFILMSMALRILYFICKHFLKFIKHKSTTI